MTERLRVDERDHLRGAQGHMYRTADGRIQINPRNSALGIGLHHGGMRRNANKKVVARLIAKQLLREDEHGNFHITDAGTAALNQETQ